MTTITNNKLTDERIAQIYAECEERDPAIVEIRAMIAELQERRKADAQEPAAQIKWDGTELSVKNVRDGFSYGVTDVYTVPQPLYTGADGAVAIPDELEIVPETWKTPDVVFGWNACRAAMLQGSQPVSNRDELPFDQWLSQQNGKIDVDCGCVTTEAFFHWLRVAYEAGNSPVAPDGWVMVPTEPTEEMLRASWREAAVYSHTAYRAMIAAAPYFREIGKSSTKHFRENAETSTNG